jgi:hypothetical protein
LFACLENKHAMVLFSKPHRYPPQAGPQGNEIAISGTVRPTQDCLLQCRCSCPESSYSCLCCTKLMSMFQLRRRASEQRRKWRMPSCAMLRRLALVRTTFRSNLAPPSSGWQESVN